MLKIIFLKGIGLVHRRHILGRQTTIKMALPFIWMQIHDPRILSTWEKGVESFRKAAQLFSPHVETVKIPYDGGIILPGYFFKAGQDEYSNDSQKQAARPTLILTTGLDGGQEELYFLGVAAALKRGYNCLTF